MSEVNLERRARRHAWAPEHELFVPCAPGLEEILGAELASFLAPESQLRIDDGGVSVRGRLTEAYRANLWLRTGDRVLLRLQDVRLRTPDALAQELARIPWEVYIPAGAGLAVQVSLKRSLLRPPGRAARELRRSVSRRLARLGLAPPEPARGSSTTAQHVLIRGTGPHLTVSLDTTGPHLHRRGYRQATGQAPLRENLAAGLLLHSGFDGNEPLLDPLCGAGTLAIEAALIARRLAPGRIRRFACESWPAHREKTLAHLKKVAAAGSRATPPCPILARDNRRGTLRRAAQNAERAGVHADLDLDRADVLTAPPPRTAPGLVVLNPPYGRRLADPGVAEDFVRDVGERLREAYPGWRCGIVLPDPRWARHLRLADERRLVVPHGGLKVTLLAGRIDR